MKIINLFLFFTFFYGFSQEQNNLTLNSVSEDACNCISKINTQSNDKNKEIKNCINQSIAKNSSLKETKEYKFIESYLVDHCDALKQLSFAENKDFKHATSNNVLAQLAYDDGIEYLNNNDFDGATEKFKRAIEVDPNFAFAWDNLGIAYRKKGEFDNAIKAYKKSLKINPKGRLPLMNIAVTYNLNKDYANAIKFYNKFIAIYKNDPEGYYGLGIILYTNNQVEKGLDHLIHAYTIYTAQNSPYRADAAKKIGYMYNDLKNRDKIEVFNKVASKYNLKIENN